MKIPEHDFERKFSWKWASIKKKSILLSTDYIHNLFDYFCQYTLSKLFFLYMDYWLIITGCAFIRNFVACVTTNWCPRRSVSVLPRNLSAAVAFIVQLNKEFVLSFHNIHCTSKGFNETKRSIEWFNVDKFRLSDAMVKQKVAVWRSSHKHYSDSFDDKGTYHSEPLCNKLVAMIIFANISSHLPAEMCIFNKACLCLKKYQVLANHLLRSQ